jgi:hypothetical protein
MEKASPAASGSDARMSLELQIVATAQPTGLS